MAVVNKYVNASVEAGKIANAALVNGAPMIGMVATEEITAGDSATSVYRFFKGVSGNLIPIDLRLYVDDAVTDESDADIGLYEQSIYNGTDGAVISADVFADSMDLIPASGSLRGGVAGGHDLGADGLGSVDIANLTKKIYEHAGHTVLTAKAGYDICVTLNTGGTTTGGTLTLIGEFIQG